MRYVQTAIVPVDEERYTVRARVRSWWWFWGEWRDVRFSELLVVKSYSVADERTRECYWGYERAAEIAEQAMDNGVIQEGKFYVPIWKIDKELAES